MPGDTTRREVHLRGLRRIEGQLRHLQRMVADDVSSIDVLTHASATTGALRSIGLRLLTEHANRCLLEAARSGGPEREAKIAEVHTAIARLTRS